jgi:hypothetical protein
MELVHNSVIACPDGVAAAATQFTTDTNVVDMSKHNRCRIILLLEQSGAGTGTVALKQSATNDGSDEKALAFAEYWKNETGKTTSALTKVSASTLTTAGPTTELNVYIFEVKADEMDIDNGFIYLRCDLTSLGNNTAACLIYELYEPRYAKGGDAAPDVVV